MNSDLFSYLAQERALNALSVNDALAVAMDRQPKPKFGDGKGNKEDSPSLHKVNLITYEESGVKKTNLDKKPSIESDTASEINRKTVTKEHSKSESSARKYLLRINNGNKKPSRKNICFDDIADDVDLNEAKSIQEAFDLYRKENTPPCDIDDILGEEKFHGGDWNGNAHVILLDFIVPAVEKDEEADKIRQYLEDFLERIGIDEPYEEVNCRLTDDGRGGSDCEVSIIHKIEED